MPVPNSFANVTTSIPLSQLDANFNTPITLGNTAIQLGNTVTTLNNMTLANVTVSSGNVTLTNVSVTTANVTTANITTAVIGTANVTTGNITTAVITTANVATANVTTSQILNYGTANQVQYLNASKALTGSSNLTFDGTTLTPNALTVTNNLTVNGNTTLGDANTDTILMTAAPSIGGAGLGMGFGFRNRIINGAMVIDQRNAGASVTPTNGAYTLDRWQFQVSQASKLTAQQSSVAPTGFNNSLLVTSSSAYSVGAADYFSVLQSIEGFNTADLMFGTANAQTVTLSFWVRSSLTGTFGGTLINGAYSRAYPFTYTISSANTWEQKSVTIAGDTTGTWVGATNGIGLQVNFGLGVGANNSGTAGSWTGAGRYSATGATSVVGTNGATFYITGVQLEKGSTATSFDYRPYGTELQLCQRYYQKVGATNTSDAFAMATAFNTTDIYGVYNFKTTMRTDPTGSASSSSVLEYISNGGAQICTAIIFQLASPDQIEVSTTQSSRGAGDGGWWRFPSATGWIAFSAEL